MKTTSSRKSFIQNRNNFWRRLLVQHFHSGTVFLLRQSFFPSAACVLALASCLLFSGLASSFAEDSAGVIASLKSPSAVTRSNAKTGSFLGTISVSNAISVGCDGTTIAVLSANGTVSRYDARTGSFQGSISAGDKSTSVQVTSGVIIVQKDRTLNRYNAKTGSFLGSTSL